MICLDTNYLIRGLEPRSEEAERLTAWYRAGEPMVVAMPAWFEFLCGPLTAEQERAMHASLTAIVPFEEEQAREAARLFNAAGRRRHLRVDSMIAATSILAGARLATDKGADFEVFVPFGLELAG
jgi:predicted nucleic acid-binding protein